MDIICPKCGEPVDHDEIHEYVAEYNRTSAVGNETTYDLIAAEFRRVGCEALGMKHNTDTQRPIEAKVQAVAARGVYDALGDDMDGAAAMFTDMDIT